MAVAYWPPAYFRFSERNGLKRIKWRVIEQDTHSPPLDSMHAQLHSYTLVDAPFAHVLHTHQR